MDEEPSMKHTHTALLVFAALCLLLVAGCGDRHEPMKPTTMVIISR